MRIVHTALVVEDVTGVVHVWKYVALLYYLSRLGLTKPAMLTYQTAANTRGRITRALREISANLLFIYSQINVTECREKMITSWRKS